MAAPEQKAASKRPHPLPGFCWMWPLGGMFIAGLGGLILYICISPPADVAEKLPPGHARWAELWFEGISGVVIAIAYGWFWHRFAVRKNLSRQTWHIGMGLILTGAAFLFINGWITTGFIYLLTLAVWAQGHTRQFFDKA